jgi:hypothetical protein
LLILKKKRLKYLLYLLYLQVLHLKIKLTKHAEHQMIGRGFSESEIEEGIKRGEKIRQNGKIVSIYKYYKIVYKIVGETHYVITIMYRW